MNVKVAKKTLALAEQYARLEPESEYPDTAAAIRLAKALLLVTRCSRSTNPNPDKKA